MKINTADRVIYGFCLEKRSIYGFWYKFNPNIKYIAVNEYVDRREDPCIKYIKR